MGVAVLGAGSWGTALALLLADGDEPIWLWDRTPSQIEALLAARENQRYLPGFPLGSNIHPTTELSEALAEARCVVVAVPSSGVAAVLQAAAPSLPDGIDLVLAAKGLDPETLRLPSETAAVAVPSANLIALSGPNLAGEVARGIPTAAVAACPDLAVASRIACRFNRAAFRVYTSDDRLGVELGGAIKNVLAIAGGVSDGLGYGDNTKATLLTRGLAEMARLGAALGARRETFYGLAGVGDLMATAASRLSRNWRVGEGLAKGETREHVLARLGQVAEGVPTAQAVARLAAEHGVEMPVCQAVERLLFHGLTPRDAVALLTERATKAEYR